MPKYTVDYFIKKFSKIPATKWCTGAYRTLTERGKTRQCCAIGHTMKEDQRGAFNFTEASAALREILNPVGHVPHINDGHPVNVHLTQKGPKARIVAALKYVKKQQSK